MPHYQHKNGTGVHVFYRNASPSGAIGLLYGVDIRESGSAGAALGFLEDLLNPGTDLLSEIDDLMNGDSDASCGCSE